MTANLAKAKALLEKENLTCAACSDAEELRSTQRGVKPLLALLDSQTSLKGFSVADRVVGRAAAFLYVLLEADEVYAGIMSEPAAEVFNTYGIPCSCVEKTALIFNRTNTGLCPMESSVLGISEPGEAEKAIRNKLHELEAGK